MTNKKLLWLIPFLFLGMLTGCNPDDETDSVAELDNNLDTDFCYTLSVSSEDYVSLVNANELDFGLGQNEDGVYEIDLGFPFVFCDEEFDKIYISEFFNLSFTYVSSPSVISFIGHELIISGSYNMQLIWDDELGDYASKIRYNTTGSPGSRVTTIEFLSFDFEPDDFNPPGYDINFQVILSESENSISYHYNSTPGTESDFSTFTLGLYGDDSTDGLFLSGSESSPSLSTSISSEGLVFPSLNRKYKFVQE